MDTNIIVLIILIFLSAFFSGVETALVSINVFKVKALLKQKIGGAEALHRLKKNPHRLLITILVGNNLVNILAASLATLVFTRMFGNSGVGIATGVMTFLILVFGEITPKTLAVQHAESISLLVARPIEIMSYVLYPIVAGLEFVSKLVSRFFGAKQKKLISEEELKTIFTMGAQEGVLDKKAARMMNNLLDFEGTKVTEIMTLKQDIQMIDGNLKVRDVINKVGSSEFSRFPVYMKDKNNIIGILDIDDVLKYIKDKKLDTKIRKIVHKPIFVPESKEIDDLLSDFEGKEIPMALVVDEYGSVKGLVSVEDILEEIVGDIFDRSKDVKYYIKKVDTKIYDVRGNASLDKVNKELRLGLSKRYTDTLGGYIIYKLKRIPHKGEKVKLKRAVIEVLKVTKRKVDRVRITKR